MPSVSNFPLHSEIIAGVLVILALLFLTLFLMPALIQTRKLSIVLRGLKRADSKNLDSYSTVFGRDRILGHLWEEFRDTLHVQKDLNALGVYELSAIRQTVP